MVIVRLDLAYDGTGFRGWARQRDQRTVQGVLEDVLERALRDRPKLSVAGRTDAGVHARGQVASFVFDGDVGLERLRRAVNGMLAPEGFDARHSATARQYRYRIDVGEVPDPFSARFVWHRPGELSLARMRTAARGLVGSHDFASFCRSPGAGATTVRDLRRVSVSRAEDRIEISATANAFLHQMVRSLVGTLVAVGAGDLDANSMKAILRARSRAAAGRVAPPQGLTLEHVVYGRVRRPARRR